MRAEDIIKGETYQFRQHDYNLPHGICQVVTSRDAHSFELGRGGIMLKVQYYLSAEATFDKGAETGIQWLSTDRIKCYATREEEKEFLLMTKVK